MKVRIAGNKIRFRLRKQDVSVFYETGTLKEVLELGAGPKDQLVFILQSSEMPEAKIQYSLGTTTLLLPAAIAEELSQTDRVGFDFDIKTTIDKSVYVLIEKDFSCLDGSDADNEGTYANPNEQAC
jgi:hypothetical protein